MPVTPLAGEVSAALLAPPLESVWVRVPPSIADVPDAIRKAMYSSGLQATAEDRQKQWVRAALGGAWEDPYRYREWHIVAHYGADSAGPGNLVAVRAFERLTTYPMTAGPITGSRAAAAAATPQSTGFTRVTAVNNMSDGEARATWVQLERLALELSDRGGTLLTDLSERRKRRP